MMMWRKKQQQEVKLLEEEIKRLHQRVDTLEKAAIDRVGEEDFLARYSGFDPRPKVTAMEAIHAMLQYLGMELKRVPPSQESIVVKAKEQRE